jgi:preprotein translocase subunit SecE
VQWPSRKELFSYTIVVVVSVVVLTSYVFGLDLLFSKSLLRLLGG